MSETETRKRLSDENARLREVLARNRRTLVRYKADRDDAWARCANEECEGAAAARAEVAALRSAVGAVRAKLPHGLPDGIEDDYQRGYAHASDDVARRLDAALSIRASVGSSGEAESGEAVEIHHCDGCGEDYNAFEESHVGHEVTPAPVSSGEAESGDRDPADYGPSDDRYADPEETTCRTCGHVAVEHTQGRYSIYGTCPAPVSSGGQTDEPLGHAFRPVAGHPDDDECTHRADGTDATYCGEPRAAHEVGGQVDGGGEDWLWSIADEIIDRAHIEDVNPPSVSEAIADVLRENHVTAARPVLSREALAQALVQQTVRVQVPNIGTVTGFLRRESADHLADVLTAGGEQRG